MTEAEWLTESLGEIPHVRFLLDHPTGTDRKFRLFGVACCRRVLAYIPDTTLTRLIDGCEVYADAPDTTRLADLERKALKCLDAVRFDETYGHDDHFAIDLYDFTFAVYALTGFDALYPESCAQACMQAIHGDDGFSTDSGELLYQFDTLRDIFGNPFRPVAFDPAWQSPAAVSLARQMYESRDFAAMPALADALRAAGCGVAAVLEHCRDPDGVHVRGCWVVDGVLDKA